MRLVWLIAGIACVVLAGIGAVLPLLPTVPFILLAAFCFARSSTQAHNWLIQHKIFGPSLRDWEENGAIRPSVKQKAVLTIAASWLLMLFFDFELWVSAVQFVVLSCVAAFIWTRPNG
jgi:uncharacterized membrane protein YbaN (DUF454 family)